MIKRYKCRRAKESYKRSENTIDVPTLIVKCSFRQSCVGKTLKRQSNTARKEASKQRQK